MSRFLKLWLVLFLVHLLMHLVVGYWVIRRLDFQDTAYFRCLILPTLQAFCLWWVTKQTKPQPIREVLRSAFARNRLLLIFVLLDAAVLLAGLMANPQTWFSLTQPRGFLNCYAGIKAILIGGWIIFRIDKWSRSVGERAWFGLFGVGLFLYGLDYFVLWLQRLPDFLLPQYIPGIRWTVIYVPLVIAVVILLLKTVRMWRARSESAALFLSTGVACALVGMLVGALNSFNFPMIPQPWLSLVKSCGFISMSAVWLGILDLRSAALLKRTSEEGSF